MHLYSISKYGYIPSASKNFHTWNIQYKRNTPLTTLVKKFKESNIFDIKDKLVPLLLLEIANRDFDLNETTTLKDITTNISIEELHSALVEHCKYLTGGKAYKNIEEGRNAVKVRILRFIGRLHNIKKYSVIR